MSFAALPHPPVLRLVPRQTSTGVRRFLLLRPAGHRCIQGAGDLHDQSSHKLIGSGSSTKPATALTRGTKMGRQPAYF